ncbi:hypothetical protein FRB91_006298 [Serendipita sp. 411]|nr:hypothetical protein FRC19_008699 [Serendipita sp. 401]KAG8829644.1 hypothetical protein FRC18_009173 [Serendipita sp. 400]KAG8859872.1 hypothetical protein FRB91_006298 [Serendipita sp. 411]KAG9057267.1 hypothetical protein FS842_007805 [Serendipita sp. 407]
MEGKQYHHALPLELIRMVIESLTSEFALSSPHQKEIFLVMYTCRDIYSWMAPILYRSVTLNDARGVELFHQSLRPALLYTRAIHVEGQDLVAEPDPVYQLVSALEGRIERLCLPSKFTNLESDLDPIMVSELTIPSDRAVQVSRCNWIRPTKLRLTLTAEKVPKARAKDHFPRALPADRNGKPFQITEIAFESCGWCERCFTARLSRFFSLHSSLRRCILVLYSLDNEKREKSKKFILEKLPMFQRKDLEVRAAFLLHQDFESLSFSRLEADGEDYWKKVAELSEVESS